MVTMVTWLAWLIYSELNVLDISSFLSHIWISCSVILLLVYVLQLLSFFIVRAGLLYRNKDEGPHYFSPGSFRSPGQAKVILNKGRGLHNLDLNILPLQRHHGNASAGIDSSKGGGEIEIRLRLGKQEDYLLHNHTDTQIYVYKKTMPNFFLGIGSVISSLPHIERKELKKRPKSEKADIKERYTNFTDQLHDRLRDYQNRTRVLFYQHDRGGYATRDCLVHLGIEANLVLGHAPLSTTYRQDWERLSLAERQQYQLLYGSLSFGACEGLSEKCVYAAMVSHPLDRLLKAYTLCRNNSSRTMCHFLHVENSTGILNFLKLHGTNLFQKLLYYSRHCRLVGADEICIHDDSAYFVLSMKEKKAYLHNILNNLHKWFGVVGLMEKLGESLKHFQTVFGLDFPKCQGYSPKHKIHSKAFHTIFHSFHYYKSRKAVSLDDLTIDGQPYHTARKKLMRNPNVRRWLYPDLVIYRKLQQIFNKQSTIYGMLRKKVRAYYGVDVSATKPKSSIDSRIAGNTPTVNIAKNVSDTVSQNLTFDVKHFSTSNISMGLGNHSTKAQNITQNSTVTLPVVESTQTVIHVAAVQKHPKAVQSGHGSHTHRRTGRHTHDAGWGSQGHTPVYGYRNI